MMRVPSASRDLLPQHLQPAFDAEVKGSVPSGNRQTLLYSPEACRRAHHWADYLRKDSLLSEAISELAMLVVAREHDCQYIWALHAAAGKKAGLSADLVEALREKKPLPHLKPEEAVVIKYGQEFYRTHRVSKGTFQEALEQFGAQGLVELTMLMGFYSMLSFNLIAFDIDLPDQRTEPILPV